ATGHLQEVTVYIHLPTSRTMPSPKWLEPEASISTSPRWGETDPKAPGEPWSSASLSMLLIVVHSGLTRPPHNLQWKRKRNTALTRTLRAAAKAPRRQRVQV